MVEGSGLPRRDRITPAAMLAVLKTFKPYVDLLNWSFGDNLFPPSNSF